MILFTHQRNAEKAIDGPNEIGVFPDSMLGSVPPVVADANVLSRDLLRGCKQQQHTVLVNAVNSGMMRLYCARHVVDEIVEHAGEWSNAEGVPVEQFLEVWNTKYLPLIRLVEVEEGLLSPEEQERIALLEHGPQEMRDADDVPSATLALQLGAFFLSRDKKPLWAVYGRDVDLGRHYDWLAILRLAGDAGVTGQLSESAEKLPSFVGNVVFLALKWVWEAISSWVAVAAVGLGGYAVYRASPEKRRAVVDVAGKFIETVVEVKRFCENATAAFLGVAPEIPSWEALARTNDPDAVLARASLFALARSPMTHRSAVELACDLPDLSVPRGEAKVRFVLRQRACFELAYEGRWQVGKPATFPPA